jgi:alpha-N-arabinofuranosidase
MSATCPIHCLTALVVASACALLGDGVSAQTTRGDSLRATISVDAGRVLGPVNQLVFGHNVEAADTQFIFSPNSNPTQGQTGDGVWDPVARRSVPEVVRLARQIRMPMLRYPGGCLVHNFDWKKAVGPLQERPNFTFGVDEFIEFCNAAGAVPLMNVSAYVGGPREAAELVEYLNAPATPEHPWAMKRAESGHPEPYGVIYFEMGNESDHGNHDVKPFRKHTPESYADWFNDCSRLMRAVDPEVKMGALMGTGTGPEDPWNRTVLTRTKGNADFVIVHTYAVGMWNQTGERYGDDLLMRACMAAGPQIAERLGRYRELIRDCTGRDLPLAITEFNASFVGDAPYNRRYSLGAALFSAEYLRELLQPEANVLMANYWHFINGYWGMVHGPRLPDQQPRQWRPMAAWYLYRLWAQHFGEQLVHVDVDAPVLDFEGALRVRPAAGGDGLPEGVDPEQNLLDGLQLSSGEGEGHRWRATGPDSVVVELDGMTGEAYPLLTTIQPILPGSYTLSYTGRATGDLGDGGYGLGFCDTRGWDATQSASAVEGVGQVTEWTQFAGGFSTLRDCPGLLVVWRLRPGGRAVTGRIELRDIRVTPERGEPAYPALTATASLSDDERTLYVIVFNKHHAAPIEASIDVGSFAAASARLWTVTGPSLAATNLGEERVKETVSGQTIPVEAGRVTHVFPPHSMTALELTRGG